MSHRDLPISCSVATCYGPVASKSRQCQRHILNPAAPPMPVHCECATPDIERLPVFGPDAAYCRRCGSPMLASVS